MRATLVLLLGALASPLYAQLPPDVYPEPVPRARRISLPVAAIANVAAGAPALGIPAAPAFFRGPAVSAARTGELPLVVLLAGFAESGPPPVSSVELQRLLFDGPAAAGTLPEFYEQASRGMFSVRGTVGPYVQTSVPILDAAGEQEGHGWIGPRMRAFVAEAIRLSDPAIDFGLFDNDGPDGIPNSGDDNGFVDGLAVRYFEVSGACGGPAPWPHFGAARDSLNNVVETADRAPSGAPIRVQVYIADSAMDCTGEEPEGVGVLAHEFGHLIGLPDLYRLYDGSERENRAWTVGCFDLMAAGAWGCGTGPQAPHFGPTFLSPLMKSRLGWLDLVEVEVADRQEYVLEPAQSSATALRVRLAPNSLESFIFEYRPRASFDRDLPAEGVLVYHYDEMADLRPVQPARPPAYGYHLVEADGDDALRRSEVAGGNRGEATDVFARNGSIAMLDNGTTPSTRDHLGGNSTLTIHSMLVSGGVARVTLSAGTGFHVAARELSAAATVLRAVDGSLRFSGGAPPFSATIVAGTLPPGVSAVMVADALRITGEPLEVGTFVASFLVRDAAGEEIGEAVRLDVTDLDLDASDLLRGIGTTGVVGASTREYLDRSGNRNGELDVGDLRKYLLRTGRVR